MSMQTLFVAAMSGALIMLASVYGLAIGWRVWHVFRLHAQVKGYLVLTFDDGPGPYMTARLRELLRREGVRATFFITGFRADKYPDVVEQTVSEGHEIASHSQYHVNAWRSPLLGAGDAKRGLAGARKLSPSARFFRPPFGKATLFTHLACALTGFRVVYWTIDCKDAESHTIRDAQDVTRELQIKGGGVVLMHDLDMDPQQFPEREARVIHLCESLIHTARSEGLSIVCLGELFPDSSTTS